MDISFEQPLILKTLYESSLVPLTYPYHIAISPDAKWLVLCNKGSPMKRAYHILLFELSDIMGIISYNKYLTTEDEPRYGPFRSIFSSDSIYQYVAIYNDLAIPPLSVSSFFVIKIEKGTIIFSIDSEERIATFYCRRMRGSSISRRMANRARFR